MQEQTVHSVSIEQEKSITVSGVESVLAFSDTKILLSVVGGKKLHVSGTELKIVGFSKTSGAFNAVGKIVGVSYGGKGFASRIFK